MGMGISDGARLMRSSFEIVRRDRALLWFPVISTACLAVLAAFWIYEGSVLHDLRGPELLFVPLVALGLYSLYFVGIFFSVALGLLKSIKGLRWAGTPAQVAWSFATIFVVPLIALEGLDAGDARRRSLQLVRENWRAETGGLGALQAALLVPGLLFFLDWKLLSRGDVHSLAGKALLWAVLVCGFGVAVAVSVVRQVFAVSLYRAATPSSTT
jgi:hypothetical protein